MRLNNLVNICWEISYFNTWEPLGGRVGVDRTDQILCSGELTAPLTLRMLHAERSWDKDSFDSLNLSYFLPMLSQTKYKQKM